MKILSLSHYDLDGFGCQLCIHEKFKKDITFDNCGYSFIDKKLNEYNFNNYDLIFITDLNFNKEQQELLYKKLQNFKGHCIYIDHHQYETTEILEKSNLKLIIDDTKSATLKTYEVLKLKNENLKKLCDYIDIYDMWRIDNKKFKIANLLNDWFWKNDKIFMYQIIKNNYNLSFLKNDLKEIKKEIDLYIKENINKKIFYDKNNKILISFDYKFSNHFQEFFNYNFLIIIQIENNRISIRDKNDLKEKIALISKKYNGDCGGHTEAYGMVISNLKEKYKDILKDIVDCIENYIPF